MYEIIEKNLSEDILKNASLRGNEYAWPPEMIPDVIEAARKANLVSIGGQLQFRTSKGICEEYAIQVDTYKSVSTALAWDERVELTAKVGLRDYEALLAQYDFLEKGRQWALQNPELFPLGDESIKESMCFVWYLEAPKA